MNLPRPVSPPTRLRLMIVEDEALIADELEHRLQALGHVVVAVCDTADAAIAAAGRERPDLVLMDIRLKGAGDGIEAAERIYAEYGVPAVYLTSHSDQATFARARSGAGTFGYLIKPVQERELVIAIGVALQRCQRNAELYENVLSCEAVVRELADGVIVSDEHGHVRAMNRAAEVMTAWQADDARGQPLDAVLRLEDGDGASCTGELLRRLRAGERAECKDARLPRIKGAARSVWATASPVLDRERRPVGAVTVVRDITDRKTAQDALRASHAKTEFLSRMSHEVRTPLNAMLGFTELLISDAQDQLTPRQRERLQRVLSATNHLRALIDDVMDVSMIEAGQLHLQCAAVPLPALLDTALEFCGELARRHGVQVQRLYAGEAPSTVMADPVRLRQALVNVLTNAIKYNHRGGAARVQVRREGLRWMIEVADDGLGMTPQQLDRLFEPFNRLGRQHGTVEGTGLGLSLTRQLLQRMDGEIRVHSREGQGTRVELLLPAADDDGGVLSQAVTEDEAELPAGAIAGRILYIEDNPVNTLLVEEYLSRWPGVQLSSAADGATGLQRADELQPDLILLDMHLPDMDGVELLRRLRLSSRTAALRVAALSASAMAGDVEKAHGAGVMTYLTKPLDFKALERLLRRCLAVPAA